MLSRPKACVLPAQAKFHAQSANLVWCGLWNVENIPCQTPRASRGKLRDSLTKPFGPIWKGLRPQSTLDSCKFDTWNTAMMRTKQCTDRNQYEKSQHLKICVFPLVFLEIADLSNIFYPKNSHAEPSQSLCAASTSKIPCAKRRLSMM